MTREAKIGMLTGLGVIILIGVLLSSYLGNGGSTMPGTTRMAALPIGEIYRQQVLQPMGVPAPAPGPKTKVAEGVEVVTPIDTTTPLAPLPAMVADMTPGAPVIGPAVSPMRVAPQSMIADLSGPPTIEVADPRQMVEAKVRVSAATVNTTPPPAVTSVTYEIVPGDNLAKIARKFYGASKMSDVNRIVKANATMLKDASSPLLAGKKLTIPNVAAPAAPVKPAVPALTPASKSDAPKGTIVVPLPGDGTSAPRPDATETPVHWKGAPDAASQQKITPADQGKPVAKTYKVQPGDGLRQIAATIATKSGVGVSETLKKIQSLNNISDPDSLRAGTTLKLP